MADFDPELKRALDGERRRQEEHIELIASENYASPRVLAGARLGADEQVRGRLSAASATTAAVNSSTLPNSSRSIARRSCSVPTYANVQPHSGSQANAAAYFALIKPGDTLLGMSLDHGGHLTHGAKVNFSGTLFQSGAVRPRPGDRRDRLRPGRSDSRSEHRPKLIIAGILCVLRASSTVRVSGRSPTRSVRICWSTWHTSPDSCAVGLYPNPVSIADIVTTTTHKTLRGPRGGMILARANAEIEEANQLAGVSRHPGRPVDARDCREGGRVPRGTAA